MASNFFLNKVAIITGSSRGIGKAIAFELVKRGAYVVLNGRKVHGLQQTEKELKKLTDKVMSVCCDISTSEGSKALIENTINRFKKIDILINNAGVSMRGQMADLNPEVFKRTIDCNLLGSAYTSIESLKYLRETQGSIVYVSSLAGIRGLPELSAYCSSKMGLRAMAETIRIEEAKNKIHVGLILAGVTAIEANKESIAADGSTLILNERNGKKVDSTERVALAILKNIRKRKFVTVLTPIGKLNYYMQALFPLLVERIIMWNLDKFNEANK
jgi:short-subunit dehydrogenase